MNKAGEHGDECGATPKKRRGSVLIVEDESLIRWSLSRALQSIGLEVTAVGSGEEAVEKLSSALFDLVVTDLKLPCIDGYQVAHLAKSFLPPIPVIMISSSEMAEVRNGKEKSLIDGFVGKPFDLKTITSLVSHFVSTGSRSMALTKESRTTW